MAEQIEIVSEYAKNKKIQRVELSRITVDRKFNVRSEYAYSDKNPDFKALVQSFATVGWREGSYPVLSKHEDGSLLCLQAHRRILAAIAAGITHAECVVLTGLTREAELAILVDQGGVKLLGSVELYEAYKRLRLAGFGRAQIAVHLKRSTSWVQDMERLYALPPYIQEQWRLNLEDGKTEVKIGKDALVALHKAFIQDRDENGIYDPEDSPRYQAELNKIKTDGETSDRTNKKNGYTAKGIEGLANGEHRPWLKALFLHLSNKPSELTPILDAIRAALDAYYGTPDHCETVTFDKNAVPFYKVKKAESDSLVNVNS